MRATLTLDTIPVNCTFASFSNRSKVTRFGVGMNMVHSLNYRVHTRTMSAQGTPIQNPWPGHRLQCWVHAHITDSKTTCALQTTDFYTDSMTVPQNPIECIPCIPQIPIIIDSMLRSQTPSPCQDRRRQYWVHVHTTNSSTEGPADHRFQHWVHALQTKFQYWVHALQTTDSST